MKKSVYSTFGKKPSEEMTQLLVRAGSNNYEQAVAAQVELAKALSIPLQKGVLNGDILGNIYEADYLKPGEYAEYPLDFLSPGSEKEFVAYTIPKIGRIPERHVDADYLMVPTIEYGNSIDTSLKYAKNGKWNVVGRMMQVIEAGFVRKANTDGWRTILAAGEGRNLTIYDDAAPAGLFTKRLVALMEIAMRRNAGGNSTSLNRGKLTDLYISPELHGDVLSWDLTQVPDTLRQQIYTNWGSGGLAQIGPVTLHDLDELGVGAEFQLYFEGTLGGTLPSDKLEIVVGLDLLNRDSFYMPIREDVQIFEDTTFHRQRRFGFYGWGEMGWAIGDSRRVLLGAA